MRTVRAALVPGAPALLPQHAGQVDPVADLRAACVAAVADLVAGSPAQVLVVAAPPRAEDVARGATMSTGLMVACHLLTTAGHRREPVDGWAASPGPDDAVLLVGNGSARRSEKAPGHLDERAFGFDDALERAVRDGERPPADHELAEELWCFDLPVLERLHDLVIGPAEVRWSGDPYGVAYWVATWPRLRAEPR